MVERFFTLLLKPINAESKAFALFIPGREKLLTVFYLEKLRGSEIIIMPREKVLLWNDIIF